MNAALTAIESFLNAFPAAEKLVNGTFTYAGEDTGVANAYVVTLDPAPTAYVEGMTVDFKAANSNTGPSTIDVNGLGVKAIRSYNGGVLVAGQIPAGSLATVRYDGSIFRVNNIVGVNVPADGSVTNAKLAAGAVTDDKVSDLAFSKLTGVPAGDDATPGILPTSSALNSAATDEAANPLAIKRLADVRSVKVWVDTTSRATNNSPYVQLGQQMTFEPKEIGSSLLVHAVLQTDTYDNNSNSLGYYRLRRWNGATYVDIVPCSVGRTGISAGNATSAYCRATTIVKALLGPHYLDANAWKFALFYGESSDGATLTDEILVFAEEVLSDDVSDITP